MLSKIPDKKPSTSDLRKALQREASQQKKAQVVSVEKAARNRIDLDSWRQINYDTNTYDEFLDKITSEALCMALVVQEDPNLYIVVHYLDRGRAVIWEWGSKAVDIKVFNHQFMYVCAKAISKLHVKHYYPPEEVMRFNVRMLLKKVEIVS